DLAREYGIRNTYDNLETAIQESPPDTVFDITLMPAQFIDTLSKLPNGSAVLIQKPMGDSIDQSKAILELCREKNLVAAVNCQLRQAPFVNAARYMISEGLLGEIYDMEIKVTVETPWELFPHVMV